jgi:hypothetical protein
MIQRSFHQPLNPFVILLSAVPQLLETLTKCDSGSSKKGDMKSPFSIRGFATPWSDAPTGD